MTIQPMLLDNHQMVGALRDEYPHIQVAAFWKSLLIAFPDFAIDPRPFKRVPDAFVIRPDDMEVDVFEVEITHPIPRETMRDWCLLWFDLDTFDITMRMYVVNRYGHINEVNLQTYWHALEIEPNCVPDAG